MLILNVEIAKFSHLSNSSLVFKDNELWKQIYDLQNLRIRPIYATDKDYPIIHVLSFVVEVYS